MDKLQAQIPNLLQLRTQLEAMVRRDLLGPAGGPEEEVDERAARGRYLNLKAGVSGSVVMDGNSVLVKPEAALRQIRQDEEAAAAQRGQVRPEAGELPGRDSWREPGQAYPAEATARTPASGERRPRRFYGTVEIDPIRAGRDVGQIAEAVIQHLAGQVGARVKVTLEIEAELSDGAPDNLVRTVTENARTLKFRNAAFE